MRFFILALVMLCSLSSHTMAARQWHGPVTITRIGHLLDANLGDTMRSVLYIKFAESISVPNCAASQDKKIAAYLAPSPNWLNEKWTGTWQSLLMSAQAQNKQVMMYLDDGICYANYGAYLLGVEIVL